MDQTKIGAFIQSLRKEKALTQKELADRLGITDRAISKWENGRGMPEVSLMKPLCDCLGITINELLCGERIEEVDYQEKSEFNFLNTMDFQDKKIKRKSMLLRIISVLTVLLLIAGIIFVCALPVTRGYFRSDEHISILYVHKTLPICEDGVMPERYEHENFVDQDITEKIDQERLKELLPLMRISVHREQGLTHWVGDVTYEMLGYFTAGPRAGKSFVIYLGDHNYLMHNATDRGHVIVNPEIWLRIFGCLEGWNEDEREVIRTEDPRVLSIYYHDMLYTGAGQLYDLPHNAERVGSVTEITDVPDAEGECSFGIQGNGIWTWTEGTKTYLGVQVYIDNAYGIPINTH